MDGNEFLKRLKKWAKQNDVAFEYDPRHGKGSHGTILLGKKARTTLKDPRKELTPAALSGLLRSLGLTRKDLGL